MYSALDITKDDTEHDASTRLMSSCSTRDKETKVAGQVLRKPGYFGSMQQLLLDVILTLPAGCFIIYAIIVLVNSGLPLDQDPIPALQTAAKYSPTVFPIAFAAVAAGLLKAAAAWKLEQGISMLSLEHLLSCRTVFSAITTPISLRSATMLTPALLFLWALSPGGQAALRVMEVVPSTAVESWPYQLLNFTSEFPHGGESSSAGFEVISRIQNAFVTALSSPGDVKSAAQDLFEFEFETSYMSANCSLEGTLMNQSMFMSLIANSSEAASWNNDRNLLISAGLGFATMHLTGSPLLLEVATWGHNRLTNATCFLTQVYVEVEVSCHGPQCAAVRVRRIPKSTNDTARAVLHKIGGGSAIIFDAYMSTFVRAGLSLYDLAKDREVKPYASAIETYFTDPDTPYSAVGISSWNGTDVYPIGEVAYSQRLSQLLNTFWLTSVASHNITGIWALQRWTKPFRWALRRLNGFTIETGVGLYGLESIF
ncbi:hypothetical protein CcaCcLH18_03896 [Colletotrichum camelliae]|nr:hypothetical protein CcaCcLH18_03896 [Colletotrichum camelliae]